MSNCLLGFVDNFADDASGTNKYAKYQYIGSSMIVSISHPEVTGGLNLSYGASGAYDGWDRFGRIVDQLWADDSANTIDQIEHTYDRGGNRLTRTNGLNSALDEVYTYDGLDRLIDTSRGGADLQDWSLDALGNWRGFTDGATTQTRTGNAANEITGISGGGWIAPTYDAAGNMTSGPKPGAETTRLHFTYDAWNRLVEVKNDNAGVPGTTMATYEYDGRNYRVEKTVGTDTFDVFYNEAWQVLEVRKNGDTDPLEQNIWDQRYIDAPVVRFYDANTDGDYADAGDSTLYYAQDANFNVTALVDAATGNVVERYSYDPYGKATVYDSNWNVRSTGSAYNNELGYASYRLDLETGLYQVRNRFYHTALGTWISRDPIGYAGGINLYEYVAGNSPKNTDPFGLFWALYDTPAAWWKCSVVAAAMSRGSSMDRSLFGSWLYGNGSARKLNALGFDVFDSNGSERNWAMQVAENSARVSCRDLKCGRTKTGVVKSLRPRDSNAFSGTAMVSGYQFWYECTYKVTKQCANNCCTSIIASISCDYHARDKVDFWKDPNQTFGMWGIHVTDRLVRACYPGGQGFILTSNMSDSSSKKLPCN